MAKSKSEPLELVQAAVSFIWNGRTVRAGDTIEVGHPMIKGRGRSVLFRPFKPTWPAPTTGATSTPTPPPAAPAPAPTTEPADASTATTDGSDDATTTTDGTDGTDATDGGTDAPDGDG